MGLFNISLFGGLSAGPVMGGLLKDWLNIQASFTGMGILTLLGFLLCLVMLPTERLTKSSPTRPRKKSVDYMDLIRMPPVFSIFVFRTCFTNLYRHHLDLPAASGRHPDRAFQFRHRPGGHDQCAHQWFAPGPHGIRRGPLQQKIPDPFRRISGTGRHALSWTMRIPLCPIDGH